MELMESKNTILIPFFLLYRRGYRARCGVPCCYHNATPPHNYTCVFVSQVAPSILGAAVCEAGAFFVGALTDIPALRQFCLVAATAVVVGFFLQVLLLAINVLPEI